MNPGAVEEAGKAASGFMEAMKSQPLALSLVVMNFALLGYMFWEGHERVKQRDHFAQMLLEQQSDNAKLLANCLPARDLQELLKGLGIDKRGEQSPPPNGTTGRGEIQMTDEPKKEEPKTEPKPPPQEKPKEQTVPGGPATIVVPPSQR